MQTKIEGIVLSKVPFKERDVIASILLRSGKKISVLFPGGSGGGKKIKSSLLEIGHMLKVELRRSKSSSDLYGAKEWQLLWVAKEIRLHHRAFFLSCFFLEVIKELSFGENLHDENSLYDENSVGNFRVLSNALYYLEDALILEQLDLSAHLFLFLSKILAEHGLFPEINECVFCGEPNSGGQLIPNQGGFACSNCSDQMDATVLHSLLKCSFHLAYKDYRQLGAVDRNAVDQLLNYFYYNFQLSPHSFKSHQMLF